MFTQISEKQWINFILNKKWQNKQYHIFEFIMQDWNEKKIMTDKYIKIPYGAGGGADLYTKNHSYLETTNNFYFRQEATKQRHH